MKGYLLLLCLLFSGLLFANGSSDIDMNNLSQEVNAHINFIEGLVLINGEEASEGLQVFSGDVIETGEDGFCEIEFLNRNVFQIWENSLASLHFEAEQSSINLERGSLAALFDKLAVLTQENPFKINTPTGIAGIRGTAFFIAIEDQNNSYICACNGTVSAESEGIEPVVLEGVHHKALRVSRASDGSISTEAAPLLYHSDEDMGKLYKSINKETNWEY